MRRFVVLLAMLALAAAGCSSTSNHALLTGAAEDGAALLHDAHPYDELGPVDATACRFYVLAIVPFGDSTVGVAMKKALGETGGNAILNASVTTGLYGFMPIFNVLSFSCTEVQGTAIRIH